MKIKMLKNKFYTIRKPDDSMVVWNKNEIEIDEADENVTIRESNEDEKRYWSFMMDFIDKERKNNDFTGTSLSLFDKFMKDKNFIKK